MERHAVSVGSPRRVEDELGAVGDLGHHREVEYEGGFRGVVGSRDHESRTYDFVREAVAIVDEGQDLGSNGIFDVEATEDLGAFVEVLVDGGHHGVHVALGNVRHGKLVFRRRMGPLDDNLGGNGCVGRESDVPCKHGVGGDGVLDDLRTSLERRRVAW